MRILCIVGEDLVSVCGLGIYVVLLLVNCLYLGCGLVIIVVFFLNGVVLC